MINTDRGNRKSSDLSNVSYQSDRIGDRSSSTYRNKNPNNLRLSNEQVDSIRSSKHGSQDKKSVKALEIIESFINYLKPGMMGTEKVCPVCLGQFNESNMVKFDQCGHEFCNSCFKQYIDFKFKNFQPILCPLQGCNIELPLAGHIYNNVLTQEQRTTYQKFLIQQQLLANPDLRLCKNQKCTGKINTKEFKQLAIKNPTAILQCQTCKMLYCNRCFQAKHQGQCDDDIAKFLERNKKYRKCNRCKRVIQKTEGCTHMTCLCGFYFCYMCGEQLKDNHECKVPVELNCMERVRWDVEHRELFYQTNCLSFHKCLYFFQINPKTPIVLRIMYNIFYTLTIYPVSIVLAMTMLILFFTLVLVFLILLVCILPILEMCKPEHCCIIWIKEIFGSCGLFCCVLLFYPIFVVILLIDAISQLFANDQAGEEIQILFVQLGYGIRNALMMPCILALSSQNLYKHENPQQNGIK